MAKRYAEEIYVSLTCKLTDDCYVTRVGAHLYDGKLVTWNNLYGRNGSR